MGKEETKDVALTPSQEKGVSVRGDISFNKTDLASVAIAKAERQIRERIRVNTKESKEAGIEIRDKREEFQALGENALPPEIKKVTTAFTKHIAPHLDRQLEAEVVHTLAYDENDNRINSFKLTIHSVQNADGRGVNYYETSFPSFSSELTSKQKIVEKQIELLAETRDEANRQVIEWKSKLGDMPTFERQIKAVVVESEMKKSDAGKSMLDAMDKNFEDVMKMLG